MSERIRGLSIDLDLDDTKVTQSIANVRRAFKAFNSDIRTNMNNFRHSEKTTESYNQVIDDLNKNIDKQKDYLDRLNREYDELQASGKGNSREAMNLAAEISKQADNVNYLENQLKKINVEFKEFERQQAIASSGWGKLGNTFTNIGKQMGSVGQSFQAAGAKIQGVGSSLTSKITKPALGATAAVGGIAAGFGWKRLSAMDTASAQLEGFTGDAKHSEKVMKDVKEASKTGMATLAENTAIATGALAAGVDEGDELQKYIKLVGDAATASGAPIEEMSQIFNRVQGTGKLMGTELEMIEHRLPGFTSQMAESMGMSVEEFRSAVSEGKISAEDFQEAMTERVDGTAELMANTWSGMTQNLKSYIGILGEAGLSETFDSMKDSLGKLIDVMKSDEAVELAKKIGESLGNAVKRVTEIVMSAIKWFAGLETGTQKLIGKFALGAVAAGPLISMFGKMVGSIGGVIGVIGSVVTSLGGLFTGIASVTKGGMAFATVFPKMGAVLGFLTGPIGIAVAAIVGLGTAFVVAYKKSETFRNIIHKIIDTVKSVISWIVDFNKAIYALFSSDGEDNGVKLLEKLGLSESMINIITTQIEFVKSIFSSIFETVSTVLTAVVNFIKEIFSELMEFWNEHGEMIKESLRIVFEFIYNIISTTLNAIFEVVQVFFSILKPVWDLFWGNIKMTVQIIWNAIKLVIGTTLDVIKGIIAAVTALIQGDWRKFLNIMRETAVSIWNRIKEFITSSVTAIKNRIKEIIGQALQIFKDLLSKMWNATKQKFQDMVNTAKNKLAGFRDAVKDLVTQAKDRALEQIDKIVDGAKAMPGKMKDGIVNGKNKVVDGVKSLGNSMASQLGKVVNGVIGGMNSVLGKVGIKTTISPWNVPSFSRGTTGRGPGGHVRNDKIARDTLALVGDKGPGNGPGTRELVEYPNGKFGLYDDDQMIFAPRGTKIYNNKLTEEMLSYLPGFSRGTVGQGGLLGKAWGGVKKAGSFIGGGIKNIADKAIDLLDAPKKVFDSLVNAVFGGFKGLNGFMLNLAKGGWNKVKEALFNFLKKKFSEAGVGKKQKWMNYPITTPYKPSGGIPGYNFNGGRHYGIDYGTPTGVNITAPTAGRVTRQSDHGGGVVARLDTGKASQYFLHMSSVKPGKVGVGESVGRSGNSGAFTTGPHVHWQLEDPKTPFLQNRNYKNPLSIIKGHQFGGLIESEGLFRLGEGNNPEVVIPLNEPSQAMKLIAYAVEKLKGKSKQTSQLPDYSNKQDDSLMLKLIETQKQQIELLTSLLQKDTDLYLDGERVSKDFENRSEQRAKRFDRFKGGVYV